MDKKKHTKVIMYIYMILLLSINSIRIFSDSIWGDEGFSIKLAKRTISGLIASTTGDVHPPLYYIILKIFYDTFGVSAMLGKAVSFLAIAIVCILAVTYFYKRFNAQVAVIIVSLVAFTSNCIDMMVEIRMYTWALCFVFVNVVFIYELIRMNNDEVKTSKEYEIAMWGGLTIASLAAGYCHYYALIAVAMMDLCAFIILCCKSKHNLLKCVASGLLMISGYLPWLIVLLGQLAERSQDYWIESVEVVDALLYIFGDNIFGLCYWLVFIFSLVFYFILRNRMGEKKVKSEGELVGICLATVGGTLGAGILLSLLIRPFFVARYIYPTIGLMAIAYGIIFTNVWRKRWMFPLFLIFILLGGSYSFYHICANESRYKTEETKRYVTEHLENDALILTDIDMFDWTVLDYYFPESEHYLTYQTKIDKVTNRRVLLMLEEETSAVTELEVNGYSLRDTQELGIENDNFTLYLMEKEK